MKNSLGKQVSCEDITICMSQMLMRPGRLGVGPLRTTHYALRYALHPGFLFLPLDGRSKPKQTPRPLSRSPWCGGVTQSTKSAKVRQVRGGPRRSAERPRRSARVRGGPRGSARVRA
eukprot:4107045-Prymnesium_polylepis.1